MEHPKAQEGPLTTLPSNPLRVVFWGTYDLGKPRTRIMLRALRETDVDLVECHTDIWARVEDKAQSGGRSIAVGILRSIAAYPSLIWRYLRLRQHDVVVVGYLGHLDVLFLWLFARLRQTPIVWDAFLSLHDTVVADRALIGRWNPVAWLLWAWDWLAAHAADLVLMDTQTHSEWFRATFGLRPGRVASVFVGAEIDIFKPLARRPAASPDEPIRILFYGQFIPLHGIETIIAAAARSDPARYAWTLIGNGQEAPRIQRLLDKRPVSNLQWIEWVPYANLRERITNADICLGIFGRSAKASRVIPNKVFQILASARPLITRDSPAIRELIGSDTPAVRLVAAGDPDELLAAIEMLAPEARNAQGLVPSAAILNQIGYAAIGQKLYSQLASLASHRERS
ncbi:MAG: glycosyltransferase [Dongiaceae bacterium]